MEEERKMRGLDLQIVLAECTTKVERQTSGLQKLGLYFESSEI